MQSASDVLGTGWFGAVAAEAALVRDLMAERRTTATTRLSVW
ncbi:hypothetical protein ACWGDS_48025 [Streptomyces sp. NPDC055059]|uniref:Uncharacterized protein n=1 Tax=Streptomyces sp. NBC_00119 TaxID=2975659 RepID=A0AAU1TZF1_9ACTN|nr:MULTISPECIES: hypothetical protein [unclassified Streptomyces]MCX4648170.1 hypothetical protein [Streptomyces sp. NBC_01446]MCX5323710.1 hypothetical protein [Streptomyces sp. NBC_00120]